MAFKVVVIGGYGNFGRLICQHLSKMANVELVVCGRDPSKLAQFAEQLQQQNGRTSATWCIDVMAPGFATGLAERRVDLVIHTAGPFQEQPYVVARSCIDARVDYCDLADCRAFVSGISVLDASAREAGVFVLSGCSSVPSLSAAIIDAHRQRFQRIDAITHGISSSARMPGLSTVRGVLAYAGRPIKQLKDGRAHEVPGWMDLTLRRLPGVGWRVLANVDAPDMALFAERFGARNLRFQAGAGLKLGGIANYVLARLIRAGMIKEPMPWAERLHRWGTRLERFGDGKSAMFIDVSGVDAEGKALSMAAQLTATGDKGPQIPSCAAVALVAKRLAGYRPVAGARACVGEITVAQYLAAIDDPQHIRLVVHFSDGRP